MRDPERIDKVLNLIKSIWVTYPDLRLMQLMTCVLPKEGPWHDGDYFYMEDEELAEHLACYLKDMKEKLIDEHNQSTVQNP